LFNVKHFAGLTKKDKPPKSAEIREAERTLSKALGTKVKIDGTMDSGKVILVYYSMDELSRIAELLKKHNI
jgi:ParB family chromosome partitioning protein